MTTNPGLVYLRTGRKSIASDHPLMEWDRWKRLGVRYVAVLYPLDLPTGQYKILFQTPGHSWVVEL